MIKRLQLVVLLAVAAFDVALLCAHSLRPIPTVDRAAASRDPTVRASAPGSPVFNDATRSTAADSESDYSLHVEQLKKKLPSNDFTIVVQPPFVVIGDESPDDVREHSERTVKWAVDKLKQDYFSKDPKEILDIWLFKDAPSYERNALALFGAKPSTPYGYYSSSHRALIMNISTGGGTLVHEIVHPFVEANFPNCPPWLNEGLGSLYEQSGEVKGHIHGYTNWRLPGLQNAIKAGQVPAFKTLMGFDARSFYNDDKGTNYAQSRYLCYYLQQRGLLVKFYRQFLANQKADRTGYETLQRILKTRDMKTFKLNWEKYVLGLQQGYEVTVLPSQVRTPPAGSGSVRTPLACRDS